jgi:hypothetical protein
MELRAAFEVLFSDVTAAEVSERQVTGMRSWQELTLIACGRAVPLGCSVAGLHVRYAAGSVHRTWRMSSGLILAALAAQVEEARRGRARAETEARRERAAAEQAEAAAAAAAAGAAAAWARAAAAHQMAAAVAADNPQAAASFEAEAQAAGSEAAAAEAQAEALRQRAAEHRERAEQARALARELLSWETVARDAEGTGRAAVAAEQPIAVRVGEGIARAGGVREVPGSKWFAVRHSTPLRAFPGARAAR